MSTNTSYEKRQESLLYNSLQLAAGVGVYVECVSCPNKKKEPDLGEEEMDSEEFFFNEVYKWGWRYGTSFVDVLDENGNVDGEVKVKGPHCRHCTDKETFKTSV
jgi:hypothetical protein